MATETEVKHTPGPWRIFNGYSGRDTIAIMRSPDQQISIVSEGQPHGFEATDANACLITAAPRLLAACHDAIHALSLSDVCQDEINEAADRIRAAIAAASPAEKTK